MQTLSEAKADAERATKEAAAIEAAAKQEHEKQVKAAEAAEKKRIQQEEAAAKREVQEREQAEKRRAKEEAEAEKQRLDRQMADISNLSPEEAAALTAKVTAQAVAVKLAELEDDFAQQAAQQVEAFWAMIDAANEQRFQKEAAVDRAIDKENVKLNSLSERLNDSYNALNTMQSKIDNEFNAKKKANFEAQYEKLRVEIDDSQLIINEGWERVYAMETERNTLSMEGHLTDLKSQVDFRQTYWSQVGTFVTSNAQSLARITDKASVDYAVQDAVVVWLTAKQAEQLVLYNEVNAIYQVEF